MNQTRRRQFLIAAGALLAAPSVALAQAERRKVRIAILNSGSAGPNYLGDGFRERLRELGWREGENIEYDRRSAENDFSRLDGLAAELIAGNPDLIWAAATVAAVAAKKRTSTIPIVFSFVFDPVALGLVASLSKPGGNATGTTTRFEGLWGKRLHLANRMIVPPREAKNHVVPTEKPSFDRDQSSDLLSTYRRPALHAREPHDLNPESLPQAAITHGVRRVIRA